MKALQEKILREGSVSGNDILKVDSFLNHQIDVAFLNEIEENLKRDLKEKRWIRYLQ
uniref:Xanthine phosphoribosyltransferase n=1 Tax=Clostridioides difficile TaxID=1496 RepID=A0A381IC37_CLODI|nr:xanthine phosphoribosyltransferase [Clostridioides difficile]